MMSWGIALKVSMFSNRTVTVSRGPVSFGILEDGEPIMRSSSEKYNVNN